MKQIHRLFFYLTVLLLPTQLGLHWWPSWSMVLGRRVDYLSPTLYLTDVCLTITLALFLTETVFKWRIKKSKPTGYQIKTGRSTGVGIRTVTLTATIFVIAALNIRFSAGVGVSVYAWIKILEYSLFFLYIIYTKPQISHLIILLSAAVVYSGVLAIVQFIHQGSSGGVWWLLGERTFTSETPGIARIQLCNLTHDSCRLLLRAYATFPHPNVLGGFMASVAPVILFGIFRLGQTDYKHCFKVVRIFLWLTLGLLFTALFFTFSRSSWVVGFLGVVWVWTKPGKTRWFWPIIVLSGISIFMIFSTLDAGSEPVVVRARLLTSAFKMWLQAPVWGVGLGNFITQLPRYMFSREIYFLQPVHNIYVLVLSETGLVGLTAFLIFIWRAVKINLLSKTNRHTEIKISLLLALVLGLNDHYLLTLQQGQLWLILLLALQFIKNPTPT